MALRVTYDPNHNIAYIRLREKAGEVESVRLSDEVIVDIAPDGSIDGIELLNTNEQLHAADDGRLVVVDAAGDERSLDLVEAGRR